MPSKSEDLCSEPHCRTRSEIVVFEKPLCPKHNEERLERVQKAAMENVASLKKVPTMKIVVARIRGGRR
mgnify:FL=1